MLRVMDAVTGPGPPPSPLYRAEALAARDRDRLGVIRLAQPVGHRFAAALAVVVIAVLAAFAVLGSYTRRATVPGYLEPTGGTIRLLAPMAGTLVERRVQEGERVDAGRVLFVVSGERQSDGGVAERLVAAQLEARGAGLARDRQRSVERHAARLRATDDRLAAVEAEARNLDRERDVLDRRRAIAARQRERYESLARTGYVSPAQLQSRIDEELALEAQREGIGRAAAGLARERATLAAQRVESGQQADAERSEIDRSIALLAQERSENDARATTLVVAPIAGQVSGMPVRPGQRVGAGTLLASLVPDGVPLEAQLFATPRQTGFVETGQRVRLRYAAYPYQKFGIGEGTVIRIERSPYAPQELPAHAQAVLAGWSAGVEPVYRIAVRLDAQAMSAYGATQPLRPGALFEADIVQDRRRLYEWLLEPLYGLAGR